MEAYIKEVLAEMQKTKQGKTTDEVRTYFENIALPFMLFNQPKKLIDGTDKDPLYPYRLYHGIVTGCGFENPYSFVPSMTYSGNPADEDRMVLALMPTPEKIGQAFAIIMFTDENYEYPGYFMVVKGGNDSMYLIAWDYRGDGYNLGTISNPEDSVQIAYESYDKGRKSAVEMETSELG